jgi:hypothetical protein
MAPSVRGEIRLNADTSIYVLPPADVYVMAHRDTTFTILGVDTRGHAVTLTAQNVPAGCSFTDRGDGVGLLQVTRQMMQTGVLPISFTCADGLGAQATATTWLHVYATTASAPPLARPGELRLELNGANPGRGPLALTFELSDRLPARLDLVDVAGRLVASRDLDEFGPGRHGLLLPETVRLGSGLYWVRLHSGQRQIVRMAVLLH